MLVLFQLQVINNGSVRFSICYDVYIVAEEFDLTDVYVREYRSVRLHGGTVHYNQRPFFFTADYFVLYDNYGHMC